MKRDGEQLTWDDFSKWLLASILILLVTYTVYGISSNYFGENIIAALTAFGVTVSSIISILLVAIYTRQTRIFDRHGKIMEAQTNLMELEYTPDVAILDEPTITGNDVEVTCENKGPGTAVSMELITRIEFGGSEFYDSPLIGASELARTDGDHAGEQSLESGETGSFEGDARLDVSTLGETERSRGFDSIIQNIQSDVDRIRVSLFVQTEGHGGDTQKVSILPEEAFYTKLEELSDDTLHECRRVSTPA